MGLGWRRTLRACIGTENEMGRAQLARQTGVDLVVQPPGKAKPHAAGRCASGCNLMGCPI